MKTLTQPADAARHTTIPALRRILALAVAPAIALAACSGEAPLTADPTTPAASAESTESTGTTTTIANASERGSPTPSDSTPAPASTKSPVKVTISDPILGHTITATSVIRNLAWPAGHPVAAANFEIIGVLVTVKAGARYSSSVAPSRLTLRLGNASVAPTGEFGNAYGRLLTTVLRDTSQTGLLVYKVDRGLHPLTLQWLRPAYQVSTTDKAIPALIIEGKLLD